MPEKAQLVLEVSVGISHPSLEGHMGCTGHGGSTDSLIAGPVGLQGLGYHLRGMDEGSLVVQMAPLLWRS